jgi:hypothetical protein
MSEDSKEKDSGPIQGVTKVTLFTLPKAERLLVSSTLVCMCVCMYVYVCVCVYIYVCVCVSMCKLQTYKRPRVT